MAPMAAFWRPRMSRPKFSRRSADWWRRASATPRWRSVADLTRLLFAEPSPAPIKHWLWRSGLIESAEVRLPMTEVSCELAARLDLEIERRTNALVNAR
jgi:4-hydroxy-tetrahydrodipicolinate synthase